MTLPVLGVPNLCYPFAQGKAQAYLDRRYEFDAQSLFSPVRSA